MWLPTLSFFPPRPFFLRTPRCLQCPIPNAPRFYLVPAMHVQRLEWSCTTGDDSPATLQCPRCGPVPGSQASVPFLTMPEKAAVAIDSACLLSSIGPSRATRHLGRSQRSQCESDSHCRFFHWCAECVWEQSVLPRKALHPFHPTHLHRVPRDLLRLGKARTLPYRALLILHLVRQAATGTLKSPVHMKPAFINIK